MKNKKTLIICIVAILTLICITVGISLAFFNYAQAGTTDNTLETGSITFIYTETSTVGRGINITDAFPITDEEGKTLTGEGNVFDFKVEATKLDNKRIDYEITARVKEDSTLETKNVRTYLTKVNGTNEEEVLLDNFNNLTQTEKTSNYIEKTLTKEVIYAGDNNYSQDYRLRIWVADNTEFSNTDMNKTFTITVNVYSNASVVEEGQIALENNNNVTSVSVNNTELEKIENESYDYLAKFSEGTTSVTLDMETENPNTKVEVTNVTNTFSYVPVTKKLSTQITLDNLINGDNYFNIKVISENGKVEDEYTLKVYVGQLCVYEPGQTWDFAYTGNVQEWTVPNECSGLYKLEVWGGQGGNSTKGGVGGKGGYSKGFIELNDDNNIYIVVGGKGQNTSGYTSGVVEYGGYNGGGNGRSQYNYESSGGGGATHIAPVSGVLSNLDVWNSVYIVGAGGGGCEGVNTGGYGGGLNGQTLSRVVNNVTYYSLGGTQTNGHAKGLGQSCTNAGDHIGGGGGGGYYGGTVNHTPYGTFLGGGGGSSYIGGVPEITIKGTTYSPSTTSGINSGNGKATITLVELN